MQLDYAIASAVLMLEHGFSKVQILVSGIAPPSRHDVWDPGNATRSAEAASRGTSFFPSKHFIFNFALRTKTGVLLQALPSYVGNLRQSVNLWLTETAGSKF